MPGIQRIRTDRSGRMLRFVAVPGSYGWRRGMRQSLAGLLVFSLLAACRFLTPSDPVSILTPNNPAISAQQLHPPQTASVEDIAQAESQAWQALRAPLAAQAGAAAADLFRQADAVRSHLLAAAAQNLVPAGHGGKVQGLAQLDPVVAGTLVGELADLTVRFSKMDEGSASFEAPWSIENTTGSIKTTSSRSGSTLSSEIEVTLDASGPNGESVHEVAKGKLQIQICPDAQGKVPVSFSINMSSSGSGANLSGGMQLDINGDASLLVNDNAELDGYELNMVTGSGYQVTGGDLTSNQYVEVQTNLTVQNLGQPGGEKSTGPGSRVVRGSSKANAEAYKAASDLGFNLTIAMLMFLGKNAQDLWQNGYCVEILVDGVGVHNTVAVDSTTPFTGKVRQKFEWVELNVPISAALNGEKSLAPTEKTPAPVHYIYEAPSKEKKTAEVRLETRSKRGAASKSFDFYTDALGWKVDQDVQVEGGSIHFQGLSCDGIEGRWEIKYFLDNSATQGGLTIEGVLTGIFQPPDGKASLDHTVHIRYKGAGMGGDATGEVSAVLREDGSAATIVLNGTDLSGTVWHPKERKSVNGNASIDIELPVTLADAGQCPGK